MSSIEVAWKPCSSKRLAALLTISARRSFPAAVPLWRPTGCPSLTMGTRVISLPAPRDSRPSATVRVRPVGRPAPKMPREVVIVEALRTPIGRGHPERGVYRDVHPNALLGAVYRGVIQRSGID